jgi:hypothetical protein
MDYTTDSELGGAAAAAVIVGLVVLYFVFFAIVYVAVSLPLAYLFKRTGVEPWKAWVPFLSTYTWLQLGGQNGLWVLATLIPGGSLITSVFLYVGMWSTGKAFRKEAGFLVLGIFLPVIWLGILAWGSTPYEPERIKLAGLTPPLVGYGAEQPPTYPAPPTA